MPSSLRFAVLGAAALGLASCGSIAVLDNIITGSTEPTAASQPSGGKVYVFRGMGGRIMSWEMDRVTDKLGKSGIDAETYNHVNWRGPADEAIARYKSQTQKGPIVVVGHSAGADASVRFAERLRDAKVPVNLVVAFDPTRFGDDVPPNVDRFLTIWSSFNFFGGGNVQPETSFRGHYASIDLRNYWEVLHVNLVRMHGLQDQVVAKIIQVFTIPPNLEGMTVPIRYAPPRGVKIELWDSGLPVRAEAGDTVRSIAQKYAVPVWAITQINGVGANTTLKPGQRLIVPRYLSPMAPGVSPPVTSYVQQ